MGIMGKIFGCLGALLVLILITSWIVWESKASVAAHFISINLKAPVTIQELDVGKTKIDISTLWIGTPSHSKTSTSFSAKTIEIDTNVLDVLDNPLIIDRIDISNIFVGLEYFDNGRTNWDIMLKGASSEKAQGRDYLIRLLVLENLTVEVTQADGQKKRYPTIERMEFHNISNETGFPIKEIEKAIFKLMMKNIMDKYNLFNLPVDSPLKFLPGLFK